MIHTEINSIWLLPIWVVAIVLSYWYYFKLKKNSEQLKRNKLILFVVRFFVLSILGLLILNPFFLDVKENKKPSEVVLAIDVSNSSFQQIDTVVLNQKITEFNKINRQDVRFNTVYFGGDVSDSISSTNQKTTNYQSLFQHLQNKYPAGILSEIVLLSDGIVNEGNSLASFYDLPFAVNTVKIGDTAVQVDAKILDIFHNKSTYLNNQFPLQVKADVSGMLASKIELLVYLNDSLQQKVTQNITQKNTFINQKFMLVANVAGLQKIRVELKSSKKEKELRNNISSSTIEVLDTKKKVLFIYDRVVPDIAAISSIIKSDEDYELKILPLSEVTNQLDLKTQNAVILFGNPVESHPFWKLIAERSVGFIQLMDYQFTGKIDHQYYTFQSNNTSIDEVFPIYDKKNTVLKLDASQLSKMPPLKGVNGNFKIKGNPVNVFKKKIGSIETDYPLIQLSTIGNQKIAMVLAGGFWNWKLQELNSEITTEDKIVTVLFRSLINFVSSSKNKDRLNVFHPVSTLENESVIFLAEVLNKSYQLQQEAAVELTVKKEGFERSFKMLPNGREYKANIGTLPVGSYQIKVVSMADKDTLVNNSALIVKEQLIEYDNLVANWEGLTLLSQKTGGLSVTLANFEEVIAKLKAKEYKFISDVQEQEQPLISWKILFFILLALLTIEWFIRKYIGLN